MTNTNNQYQELLRKAEAFDLSGFLEKYSKDTQTPIEDARAICSEMNKWLVVCALERDNQYSIFGAVDNMWHKFITHTQLYMKYCNEIAGFYIHHEPAPVDVSVNHAEKGIESYSGGFPDSVINGYDRLLSRMDEVFGSTESTQRAWPSVNGNTVIARHEQYCSNGGGGCGCCFTSDNC